METHDSRVNSPAVSVQTADGVFHPVPAGLCAQMSACHQAGTEFFIAWRAICAVSLGNTRYISSEQAHVLWELLRPHAESDRGEIDIAEAAKFLISIETDAVAWIDFGPFEIRYRPGEGWSVPMHDDQSYNTLVDLLTGFFPFA